jgi:hypothetical protein
LLRGIVWKVFRQYSLAKLPPSLVSVLFQVPFLYPAPVVTWDGEVKKWKIVTGFVV